MGAVIEWLVGTLFEIVGVWNIYRAFKVLRWTYMALNFVTEMVTGYSFVKGSSKAQAKAKQKGFEMSAHFMDIVGRCNTSPATLSTMDNMIVKHNSYGDPREILTNDRISLWAVTPTEAVFTVCQADIYDTSVFPFSFLAQYLTATQLVVVSHATLHRLAQEVRMEDKEFVLIHNTARCGSTLLCQMFSNLPHTRVISEPWSFMHTHRFRRHGQLSDGDYRALTESMVKIHLKTSPGSDIQRVVMKLSLLNSPQVPLIKALFPSTKLMFITRHIEPSLESFERVLSVIPGALPSDRGDFWFFYMPFPYDEKKYAQVEQKYIKMRRNLPNLYSLALGYGGAMAIFLDNKALYSHSVVYEDLVKEPTSKAKKMLEDLDIPSNMATKALKGMESDSQKEMFTKVSYGKRVSKANWAIVDGLLKEIDSPVHSDMSLDKLRAVIQL